MRSPVVRFAALAALALAAGPAAAQTFTVTANTDTGSGSGNSGDLRYCINQANAFAGAATIQFNVGAGSTTIALSSMLPILTNASGIAIQGANLGAGGAIAIDGGSTSNSTGDRVFFVGVNAADNTGLTATTNTAFSISDLTIQHGRAQGGLGMGGGGGGA